MAGTSFWSEELSCKCLATYHPSACLRQEHVDKTQKPGQFSALFKFDISKAIAHSGVRSYTPPQPEVITNPTFSRARDFLQWLLTSSTTIAFDIETLHSGTPDVAPVCIGYAPNENIGICIPFFVGNRYFFSDERQRCEIIRLVHQIQLSDITKVAQNAQYDMSVLEYAFKIKTRNLVWDTLCAAHNIYCDLPKDLGSLIAMYSNFEYHKQLSKSESLTDFWTYNALDAMSTHSIMQGQIEEMKELDILEHFYRVTLPLISCLVEMQLTGVKVDLKLREELIVQQKQFQEQLLRALQSLVPGYLPTSPKKVMKLFYEVFNCRPVRAGKSFTGNADAMDIIYAREQRQLVKLFAKATNAYRVSVHLTGVFETTLLNGRMHTAYSAEGTDTGRVNSRESNFGTGTNLQNLQHGNPRRLLIPG